MASSTFAGVTRGRFTSGGVIIVTSSVLAAILVIAGLVYAAGTGARHQGAFAAAGCEPNLSPAGQACTTYPELTTRYVAVVDPAFRQVSAYAGTYATDEKNNLAAAKLALTAQVAAERAFGTRLAAFPFPPAVVPLAKSLMRANQARVGLTTRQAGAGSLKTLRSFDKRVAAAGATVRADIKLVRAAVDTPPAAR